MSRVATWYSCVPNVTCELREVRQRRAVFTATGNILCRIQRGSRIYFFKFKSRHVVVLDSKWRYCRLLIIDIQDHSSVLRQMHQSTQCTKNKFDKFARWILKFQLTNQNSHYLTEVTLFHSIFNFVIYILRIYMAMLSFPSPYPN